MNIEALTKLKYYYNINPINILDIGANTGEFSSMCQHIWPTSKLMLIEANPLLESNLKNTGHDYKIALLGKNSSNFTRFYINNNDKKSTGCSIYRELSVHFSDENCGFLNLCMKKLDDVVLPVYDFIKMDTQGSELDIIMGGKKVIENTKFILLEASLIPTNENSPLKDEIVSFLNNINFEIVDTIYDHIHNGIIIQQDILFRNKSTTPIL